jgi:putative Mg2+ transporter-C (MgtC) family protein
MRLQTPMRGSKPSCSKLREPATACGNLAIAGTLVAEQFKWGQMEALVEEFGHPTYTSFSVIVARLLLATVFGAAIGFEREWRNRPAGLRTHILVCVAAATFAILTIEIVHAPMFGADILKEAVKVDPIRIVEAVTAGVAFLAAGVVIFTKGEVHGLTTGAGMWLAGAIGVACGLGLWQIALFGSVLALIVLGLLHMFETKLDMNQGEPLTDGEADRKIVAKKDDPGKVEPAR